MNVADRPRPSRSAAAGGPINSAVERTDPITIADRPTVTAINNVYSSATRVTATPRAFAASGLSEANSNGRPSQASARHTRELSTAMTSKVVRETLKSDPKRIDCVEPVLEELRVIRYKNKAESPVAPPRTTPVATSR